MFDDWASVQIEKLLVSSKGYGAGGTFLCEICSTAGSQRLGFRAAREIALRDN